MRPLAVLAPTAGLLLAGTLLLAGCGAPPELQDPSAPPPPVVPSPSPGPVLPTPVQPGGPGPLSPGVFPDEIALDCAGSPGAAEILALLRAEDVLSQQDDAEVADGPYCSGTWQYAVVTVPDRDPLLMVSRGPADALELVTAGTDVCTVEVRIQAPAGIRGAATC